MQVKNILVLTHWDFNDALIQTYTLPYVKIIAAKLPKGSKIFLFTLNKSVPKTLDLSEWNIELVHAQYRPFGIKAMWDWTKIMFHLSRLIRCNNISYVHAWCTPAGGMGYILSRMTGKRLVLDSFEPHSEACVENGAWKKNSLAFKLLFFLEKKQVHQATEVIGTVSKMFEYAKEKYACDVKRFYTKPACVDLGLFNDSKLKNETLINELALNDKLVCVYAGKLGGIYYEQETFNFFKAGYDFWGDHFRVLLLSSHSNEEINAYLELVELPSKILIKKFVPHHEVSTYMGLGDFAITPVKPVPSKRYCTPIKNGEYWALGLPVVITPNISDDSELIEQNKIGAIWRDTSSEGCLEAIKTIDELLKNNTREELYQKIRPIAEKYRNFSIAEKVYKEIYG